MGQTCIATVQRGDALWLRPGWCLTASIHYLCKYVASYRKWFRSFVEMSSDGSRADASRQELPFGQTGPVVGGVGPTQDFDRG